MNRLQKRRRGSSRHNCQCNKSSLLSRFADLPNYVCQPDGRMNTSPVVGLQSSESSVKRWMTQHAQGGDI